MTTRIIRIFIFALLGIALIVLSGWFVFHALLPSNPFNGQQAYQDVAAQVAFGPRTPGSTAHAQVIVYIQQELEKAGWKVQIQVT